LLYQAKKGPSGIDALVISCALTWFIIVLQIDILQEENEALLDKVCACQDSVEKLVHKLSSLEYDFSFNVSRGCTHLLHIKVECGCTQLSYTC
jgi:hypothetical protein